VRNGKILKHNIDSGGYAQVCLFNHTKKKTVGVHVLVLTAFVGPCPAGMETLHEDGVRANNQLSNLRWGTRSENAKDKIRHGTHNWFTADGRRRKPKSTETA